MKLKKRLIGAGLTLAAAVLLTACGKSASDVKTYSSTFGADPTTFNYLLDYSGDNTAVVTNLVDGLLENDNYGNLIPALAEDWSVSKDGLTYTYKLRQDAKWFTADGEEYAPIKAQDFVTGIKYAADNKSQALDLIQNSIKGLDDYVTGANTDFSNVGVKAVDDYTVQYTLTRPEPFWNSKTTNSILFPVNEEFLTSKGKEFGELKPDSILYSGPYLLKDFTSKSSLEYMKNPHYYDQEKVTIEKVKLAYFYGSDQDLTIRNFESGAYSSAGVYPNSSNFAKTKEKYKDNPQEYQKRTAEIYKANNVNPLGGCLPLLIQLPVFVALYYAFSGKTIPNDATFLWFNLKQPDRLFMFGNFAFNLLPILNTGVTYLQQKIMSGATKGQDGNNQLQSMMYTMPLMMLFLFYRMPSGVTLYYLVSGALSLAQQYIIMKGRSDDGKDSIKS